MKKWESKLEKIYLFGLRVRGYYKINSGVDIAISGKFDYRQKWKFKEKIDEIAGVYSVDLIFLYETQEFFREKVSKEGKKLWQKATFY